MNHIRRSPQSYFEVPYPAVLYRIVESFLQNPEEAKRNVRWHRVWQIVGLKVNLHSLLVAEFSAVPNAAIAPL